MSDAARHFMAEKPPPLDQAPDEMLTEDPPTRPGDDKVTATHNFSLSPYEVEEMTEEDRERYQRSVSLATNKLNKSQNHQPPPKKGSTYPEIPPFRLPSERQMGKQNQIEAASAVSRKRKRSPTPVPEVLGSLTPQNPKPGGCRFQGVIEHRMAEEALDFAWEMENCVTRTDKTHRYIFWTDASIVFGACAAGAVVWKQPPSWEWPSWEWMAQGFPYPSLTKSTEVVEMYAIAQALKRAVDDVKQSLADAVKDLHLQIAHEVFVFTDSLGALTGVEKESQRDQAQKTREQAHTIIEYSIELHNLGAKVELHLVPGHNGVPGNVRAHGAAYAAARRAAAAAGITSNAQAIALYSNQAPAAILAPIALPSVPASPVQPRSPEGSRKRSSLLSQPQLWSFLRDKTPPVLESPVDPMDEDSAEVVKDEISMYIPGPHSIRPDRTPEIGPMPGPSFTPVNAGHLSSNGSAPINSSSTLPRAGPAKVLATRIAPPALNPRHWFMPVDARPTLLAASSSHSLSAITRKPALNKEQKPVTAVVESHKSPQGQPLGLGPLVSCLQNEPTSIDNAASSIGAGRVISPSVNNSPAAVLDSSTMSKSCSEAPDPAKTPSSMPSSLRPLHRLIKQDNGKAVFGKTALSRFIPQGNQPATKTSALAEASSCLDAPTVSVPALTQASFTGLELAKPFQCLPPCLPAKLDLSGDAKLSPRPSMLEIPEAPTSIVTTSKLRSFASPGEPKDGVSLAPLSSFYDDKLKQRVDQSPAPPPMSDAPEPPAFMITTPKIRSFASTEETRGGLKAAPYSSLYNEKSEQCEDTALPPAMLDLPKQSSSFVTAAKMRSFAFPGVHGDRNSLTPTSSFNEGSSGPMMSSVLRWPLFAPSQTTSPDVANFRAESPSDDSSSASMPASGPISSPLVTPISEEVNPLAKTDLTLAVPLNRSTGAYTPHPFHRPPVVPPIITAIDILMYQAHPDPNMPRIEGSERSPWSTRKSDP